MRLEDLKSTIEELDRAEYNFKDLISAYSKHDVYHLEEKEGYHDWENGGEWKDGEVIERLIPASAFLPLAKSELIHDEGGHYTNMDKKLYTYDKVLSVGDIVLVDGIKYKLTNEGDYKEYDKGLRIFFAKRGEPDF